MGDYFNNEDFEEFREDFKHFFPKGFISPKELGTVMHSLGKQNILDDELIDMIDELETKESKKVDEKEFMAMMSKKMKSSDTEEELIEAFKVFDRDGNGLISPGELKHIMTNLGEKMTDEEIEMMIEAADQDKDGVVNYQDFVKMMLGNPSKN